MVLVVAVLTLVSMIAVRGAAISTAPTSTVVLKVNWGAVATRSVTILGAGIIVAMAPALTIPIIITAVGGGAAAFDLTFNRCSYGINVRC